MTHRVSNVVLYSAQWSDVPTELLRAEGSGSGGPFRECPAALLQ